MRSTRRLPRLLLGFLFLLGAAGSLAWWWTHPPEPVAAIAARWAPLHHVERFPAVDMGPAFERWRLVDARRDTVFALWKRSSGRAERPWTVVLLGGLRTGDRAAALIPDRIDVNVLAMDWPWPTSRQPSPLDFAIHAGAIHDAVLRSPALLALGVEAAARSGQASRDRIALLGASLGVPPAIAAMRLTRTPCALIVLFGSADLGMTLDRLLRRALRPDWFAGLASPPLAALCDRLIRPLEPTLHTEAARRVPTLLVIATEDELLPPDGVHALTHALAHADRIELPGPHIRSHQRQRISALSGQIGAWLDSLRTDGERIVGD